MPSISQAVGQPAFPAPRSERSHAVHTAVARPSIRQRQEALFASTLVFTRKLEPLEEGLQQAAKRSKHLHDTVQQVGERLLDRALVRNARVADLMSRVDPEDSRYAERPDRLIKRLSPPGSDRDTRLRFDFDSCVHSFDPYTNTITLSDPSRIPYAAHEIRHAHDQLTGRLDLRIPEHRLASEVHAFTTQQIVADELNIPSGISRSPVEQARTYEAKTSNVYPGTLETSFQAVQEWVERKRGG